MGFAYFYMSINVGAVVGPLSAGFAQNQWGFKWGFGPAALGMVAALVQYAVSVGKLPDRAGHVLRPIRRGRLVLCGIIAAALEPASDGSSSPGRSEPLSCPSSSPS